MKKHTRAYCKPAWCFSCPREQLVERPEPIIYSRLTVAPMSVSVVCQCCATTHRTSIAIVEGTFLTRSIASVRDISPPLNSDIFVATLNRALPGSIRMTSGRSVESLLRFRCASVEMSSAMSYKRSFVKIMSNECVGKSVNNITLA